MKKISQKRQEIKIFLAVVIIFLMLPSGAEGAVEITSAIRVFDTANFSQEKSFVFSEDRSRAPASLAVIDLGGDGVNEIVVGSPAGERPEVKIYREDGSLVTSFLAYAPDFRGGVHVAAGDIDGDGKEEVITGAGPGGGPHIRVFDSYGRVKVNASFFAFDENLRNGVNVAVGDVDNDNKDEIIAGSGPDEIPQIKIFKKGGELLGEWDLEGINNWSGVNVSSSDVDGEGADEIVVAPGWGSVPEVQIWRFGGSLVKKFLAYAPGFRGGINLAAGDIDNDGRDEVITGAGVTGGPHVRIFNGDGILEDQFFSFNEGFRGGVLVSAGKFGDGKNKIISSPQRVEAAGNSDIYKYIDIDISEQKMRFYENGFILGEHLVSTGTFKMPTPLGNFKILSRSEVAYSNSYSLYMPHFMLFTKSGAGIHGLPYWKRGDSFVYEGVNHLGQRVSHGCVRLSLDAAGEVYDWAGIGTPVIVHQ